MDIKDLVRILKKSTNEDQSEDARIILVIAGTWRQYLLWCDKNHMNPRNDRARYIGDVYRLFGMEAKRCKLEFTGTPQQRDDWYDILDHLKVIGYTDKEIYEAMFPPG